MLRSFKCMKLSNRGRRKVHLTLNVRKMYSKCTPDVHFTQFPTTTTEKSLFFSNLRHTNAHKCMKMYICVHVYTFALQKIPDLRDVHPGYISSTSRVHLEYI